MTAEETVLIWAKAAELLDADPLQEREETRQEIRLAEDLCRAISRAEDSRFMEMIRQLP